MIQPQNPCGSNTTLAFKHSVFGFSPTFTPIIQCRKLKVLLCFPSSAKAGRQALFLQLQRWWEEGRWGWGIDRCQDEYQQCKSQEHSMGLDMVESGTGRALSSPTSDSAGTLSGAGHRYLLGKATVSARFASDCVWIVLDSQQTIPTAPAHNVAKEKIHLSN